MRSVIERTRDVIEADRTQDALRSAGVRLPENVANVHIFANGVLKLWEGFFDRGVEPFYDIRFLRISPERTRRLKQAGIAVGQNCRPEGRIIPRLTQKGK